ncbi:MAG: sigma-70 family RNA polymerase sigma factor [Planctomycetota bacterium]
MSSSSPLPEPDPRPTLPATTIHVRRAISGDGDSLSWLVERLSPLLLAQVSYRLGPRLRAACDPQDLVQDAWLTLLPRLGDLSARDGRHTPVLLRFLSTTLLNKANNLLKKHLRSGSPVAAMTWDEVAVDASGIVTKAIRHETRHAVLQAIDGLEPIDREILLLRGIEQQRNEVVAALLGLKATAVTMRYARALARLRAQLPGSIFDELPGDEDAGQEEVGEGERAGRLGTDG